MSKPYEHYSRLDLESGMKPDERKALDALRDEGRWEERERCVRIALEQRCERGTPWDAACVAIANAIYRKGGRPEG